MTPTAIPTTVNHYGESLETETLFVEGLRGTHFALCHVGIVPEGREARKAHLGPMVPGPWGYTVTHPFVLDNFGGSGAEAARVRHVTVGEPLTFDGLPGVWTFRSPNRRSLEGDGPVLTEYDPEAPAS